MKINSEHKDRLFRLLFGSEEYKENILLLYNALNGTDYKDVSDITIYTIEDVIYIKMKNDVALLLDSYMPLWEHQSTLNPNMPVRGLMYFGQLYNKYITEKEINIYGTTLVQLPAPQYIVFYNGGKEVDPVKKLRLSSAFKGDVPSGEFEWTATMYDLNSEANAALLNKCKPLKDYTFLIGRIRDNRNSKETIEEAVDEAVQYCIDNDILKGLLLKHRAEVISMVLTEFNEEVYTKGIREEGRQEILKAIYNLVESGKLSIQDAAEELNVSVAQLKQHMADKGHLIL